MRKTKIICTMGPAVATREKIMELALAGMNVARFNFSHGSHESHKEILSLLKSVREELNLPIAAMLDTKGPEIRTLQFEGGEAHLEMGREFRIKAEPVSGNSSQCGTTYPDLYQETPPGSKILIDDGLIELEVLKIEGKDIVCTINNGGVVKDNKGINVPNTHLQLPFLTDKDISDIRFAVDEGFDYIAASFVRSADDVMQIRGLLRQFGREQIGIISKIENRQGIDNIDEIIRASDGIMVARGDLGIEVPAWEVPIMQKQMIKSCLDTGKIVIIATQMLDSMMRNPRPTRAEVNDVANAVFEGAGAVMLSGETAAGKYPVESLQMMAQIAISTEESIDYWARFRGIRYETNQSINSAIGRSCCGAAMDLAAKAILTVTEGGITPRIISRYRPQCPIVAIAVDEAVRRQLALIWGVETELAAPVQSTDQLFDLAIDRAQKMGVVQKGDVVVISAGVPLGISGSTNLIKAQKIE